MARFTTGGQDVGVDLRYPPSPLTELTLADLRRRRSEKWKVYPEDVLPLFVAEMDVPLAPPVRDALTAAIELGDTGYIDNGELREGSASSTSPGSDV